MIEEFNYYHLENVNYIEFAKWLEATCNEIGLRGKSYNGFHEIVKMTMGKFQDKYDGPITYRFSKMENGFSTYEEGLLEIWTNYKDLKVYWEFTGVRNDEFILLLEKIRNKWNPREYSYMVDENGEYRTPILDYFGKDFSKPKRRKAGRPKLKEDIEAWKRININKEDNMKVFSEWSESEEVINRNLSDPERHFKKIILPDYGKNIKD
jgi:hypothetical protein